MKLDQAIRDLAGLAGIGLAGYGAWLIYPPAAFIAVGLALLGFAVIGTLRASS